MLFQIKILTPQKSIVTSFPQESWLANLISKPSQFFQGFKRWLKSGKIPEDKNSKEGAKSQQIFAQKGKKEF